MRTSAHRPVQDRHVHPPSSPDLRGSYCCRRALSHRLRLQHTAPLAPSSLPLYTSETFPRCADTDLGRLGKRRTHCGDARHAWQN